MNMKKIMIWSNQILTLGMASISQFVILVVSSVLGFLAVAV